MAAYADQLLADTEELVALIPTVAITPSLLGNGATELLQEVATGKVTGEEERYSRTDLWDFQANVDGAHRAFTALGPVILEKDPDAARHPDHALRGAVRRARRSTRAATASCSTTTLTQGAGARAGRQGRRAGRAAEPRDRDGRAMSGTAPATVSRRGVLGALGGITAAAAGAALLSGRAQASAPGPRRTPATSSPSTASTRPASRRRRRTACTSSRST